MRSKRVAAAMHKERRRPELRKMHRAQLLRLSRRMQWVREQQKSRSKLRFFSRQERSLPSAVRMPAEKDAPGSSPANDLYGAAESRAISSGHRRKRRAEWARLAEREIAAQNQQACIRKRAAEQRQQPRLAICARAMRKHNSIAIRRGRLMDEAANRRLC